MYHVIGTVSYAVFVPCHLFCRFRGHVQSLDPRYKWEVP
jgi:hypothetical protein